jgi:ribose transport system ATP-binding protein
LIDYRGLARRARAAMDLVGLNEHLATPVGDLPLGRRQMVEIAKALFREPRVLILDEPTSSLSAHEVETLTGLLDRVSAKGTAILYISHRLNEVMRLCQHVTVLKDGAVTADRSLEGVEAADLVRLMVGRDTGQLFPQWTPSADCDPIVSVTGLCSGVLRDIDISIRRGEVLGIGGLVGQGQDDFLLSLYGALPASARSAEFNGRPILPESVRNANALGLAYVPADRKREGLHLIHAIGWNLMLPSLAQAFGLSLRDRARERALTGTLADRFAIKGDLTRQVQALSGGNQQKVALAKWTPAEPQVWLLNDPTRGVDVETKREIYALLRRLAADGKAIVLSSSDTPELVHLCDRVAVMREGRIAATIEREALSEEAIVAAAMGAEPLRTAA